MQENKPKIGQEDDFTQGLVSKEKILGLIKNLDLSTNEGLGEFEKLIENVKNFEEIFPFSGPFYFSNGSVNLLCDLRYFDSILKSSPSNISLVLGHSEIFSMRNFNIESIFFENFSNILFCVDKTILEVINSSENYPQIDDLIQKFKEIMGISKRIFVKYIFNKIQDVKYDLSLENPFISVDDINLWFKEVMDVRSANRTAMVSSGPRSSQTIVKLGLETILKRFEQYQKALVWYDERMV